MGQVYVTECANSPLRLHRSDAIWQFSSEWNCLTRCKLPACESTVCLSLRGETLHNPAKKNAVTRSVLPITQTAISQFSHVSISTHDVTQRARGRSGCMLVFSRSLHASDLVSLFSASRGTTAGARFDACLYLAILQVNCISTYQCGRPKKPPPSAVKLQPFRRSRLRIPRQSAACERLSSSYLFIQKLLTTFDQRRRPKKLSGQW